MTEISTIITERAKELHRTYRAADKALKGTNKHDHGWSKCPNQKYFVQRAKRIEETVDVTNHDDEGDFEDYADGGLIDPSMPYVVGEQGFSLVGFLRDAFSRRMAENVDYLLRVDEDAYRTLDELRAHFCGEPSEVAKKQRRDDEIRRTLWPERKVQ